MIATRLNPSRVDFVIYHASCPDGLMGAYAAWKRIRYDDINRDVTFYAAHHGEPAPDVRGRNVAIIDFSFDLETMREIENTAASMIVLDHHKTAAAALSEIKHAVFDMNRSGAALAWNFFHPGVACPVVVAMIEDRDLWRFKIAETKAFTSWFDMQEQTFESIDAFIYDDLSVLETKALVVGRNLMEFRDHTAHKLAGKAYTTMFHGFSAGVVNSSLYQSEVGNILVSEQCFDVGLIWYSDPADGSCIVSLRSCRDDVDVSALAKRYGGGGHARASGFKWTGNIMDLLAAGVAGV